MRITNNQIKTLLWIKIFLIAVIFLVLRGHLYFGDKTLTADETQDSTSMSSIVNLPKLDTSKMSKEEAEKYIVLIDKKKQELTEMEKSLTERKTLLEEMQKSIDEKIKKLENEKAVFTDLVDKQIELSEERKKELVDFYKKMPAKKAAPIFSTMNQDLVVAMFKLLPQKQVSSILAEMSSEKSKELSEYYGRVGIMNDYKAMNDLKDAIKNEFRECK